MKVQSPTELGAEDTAVQFSNNFFVNMDGTAEHISRPINHTVWAKILGRQQSKEPPHHGHGARETHVHQGTVPDHTNDHKTYMPIVKHGVIIPTTTSAENSAKATLTSSGMATAPTSAASPLIVLRSQGAAVLGKDATNTGDDGKRPKKRHERPLNTEQRAKVLRIFGSCSDCHLRRVACQPAHHNITWEDLDRWWSSQSNIRSSTEKEFAPAAAEHLQQQNHPPFQEGTVADSGYVSACASRPCHEIDCGTMAQPEEHNGPAGDQHTVYTSLGVPHGSDYITDLCNDIYLKLKHEFLEHTQDQRWAELPKRLPDLIKALAIRIGLDRSNPASPYVMHFLHTHSK